jgi:hypothetical protein|tara:strand:- start:193 stop:507 length:315 start_codon:yes stop_codon:yes gene_type:complete
MKSFQEFQEESKKKSKFKNKKSGNVEIMPIINDGKKGMVTKPTNEEKTEVYWSSKALDQLEEIQQRESFETGVAKARRDYRSGTLLNFKQFMAKITDILDEWEK